MKMTEAEKLKSTRIKAFYRVGEFKQEVLDDREKVLSRGFEIGFESAKEFINLKKGFSSFIYAAPFSGKTAFVFDIYMYIAKKYNSKIAIFSPEAGGRTALTSYLVQVFLGKKLHGKGGQVASEVEWAEALDFIDTHFILLDPKLIGREKLEFSASEMFKQVYLAEKEYGWKIDLLLCDPYNMLSKTKDERSKTLADYTLESLTYINHVAREMDLHVQVAMHLRDEEMITDKDTGTEYFKRPHPSKVANGQSVYRVMQTGMGIWRCPAGVIETSTGIPFPENSSDFMVQKNKVLGAGGVGTFRLYYDDSEQKFYEIIGGVKYRCGEWDKRNSPKKVSSGSSALKPNVNFGLAGDLPDDSPF